MAGSYQHCSDEDGNFRADFHEMIENLGDAEEACEMMVFMIQFLAVTRAQATFVGFHKFSPSMQKGAIRKYITDAQEAFFEQHHE